ncbi:MAG: signal peptide peptidase SppA, partial [Planctomyces sp.]
NGDELIDVRIRNDYKKKKPNTELDLFSLMEILSGGSQQKGSTRPRIAVIYAEGAIVSSSVPAGLFGESGISSDKFVPMIQKLATEDNIKAIVLRVDSPGGSALASDLIWRALRSTGKPVVVSMGDVAASGGYYISMGADRIFAEPGTITGSIGVLGGKVSFEGLLNRVGVTMSIVQRGKNAGVMSLSGAFTDSEREVFQRMLDTIYRQFTEKAAAGRKMEYDKLESLARGRVYTGRRAKELGLIDDIGTLADAIAYARQIAGDSENKLELESLPRPQSPLEMLLSSQTAPSADPLSSIIRSLPESLQPAAEHFAALRAIMNETSLTIMPYSLQIR